MRQQKGCYHDALTRLRSLVDLTLHESLGGGFSPPVVARICSLSRVARSGRDRTRYTSRRQISYQSHHTQRISLSIVKADSDALLLSSRKLSASLVRM